MSIIPPAAELDDAVTPNRGRSLGLRCRGAAPVQDSNRGPFPTVTVRHGTHEKLRREADREHRGQARTQAPQDARSRDDVHPPARDRVRRDRCISCRRLLVPLHVADVHPCARTERHPVRDRNSDSDTDTDTDTGPYRHHRPDTAADDSPTRHRDSGSDGDADRTLDADGHAQRDVDTVALTE